MLFFAWNPLVLFEVAGNGHNDAVVIMFVLAGVFFFVRARQVAFIPALVLGALTKFARAVGPDRPGSDSGETEDRTERGERRAQASRRHRSQHRAFGGAGSDSV